MTVDATYLSRYVPDWGPKSRYYGLSPGAKLDLFLLILRIVLNVAAAVALIQQTERVLSWLVKDWLAKDPLNEHEGEEV